METTNELGPKKTVCEIFFFCKVHKNLCFWTFATILRYKSYKVFRLTCQFIIALNKITILAKY